MELYTGSYTTFLRRLTRPEPVALAFILNLRLTQAIIYIRFGFPRMILSCLYQMNRRNNKEEIAGPGAVRATLKKYLH